MRQRDDASFAELLCRVQKSQCTHEDIDTLRARVVKECTPNYPQDALHVYHLNKDVDQQNMAKLHQLAPASEHVVITAIDHEHDHA